ncbi:MAG: STN domain-containing protein [Opitutaceae bacterium]
MTHQATPLVAGKYLIAFARSVGVIACVLACVSPAIAATAPNTAFDLPADSAEKSLRLFSRQSGIEVVFASGIAKRVRTQPVKDSMPARQALDTMLKDTGLVVFEDKTGAFSIQRARSEASAPSPGQSPKKDGAAAKANGSSGPASPTEDKSASTKKKMNP